MKNPKEKNASSTTAQSKKIGVQKTEEETIQSNRRRRKVQTQSQSETQMDYKLQSQYE